MKNNKAVINVGRGVPAEGVFLAFDKQIGKETSYCWAKLNLHNNAFTLIELLVVVLIIGILAAIAVPQYQVAVTKSRYATLKNLTESILQAEEVYYLANGQYTNEFERLDIDMPGGGMLNQMGNTYTYPWGGCFLYVTTVSVYFNCYNSAIGMTYQVRPIHSASHPGQKLCVVDTTDNNSVQAKVCKSETGKNIDMSAWNFWEY